MALAGVHTPGGRSQHLANSTLGGSDMPNACGKGIKHLATLLGKNPTPLPATLARYLVLLKGAAAMSAFPASTRAMQGSLFAYAPGQYAFLCLPDISHLEWHPFTLSAAPSDSMARNRVAFDIKAMPPHPALGKGAPETFTPGRRRLAETCAAGDLDPAAGGGRAEASSASVE